MLLLCWMMVLNPSNHSDLNSINKFRNDLNSTLLKHADHIYNVIDIYHRDDSGQSSTQIMFNLFNTETIDYPFSNKNGESMKKDQMYVSFWNLHTVNWGNKDWEECLELATVGAVQQIAAGDETFTNACATWQKTLWN